MKTIWKFIIQQIDNQLIEMPEGAEIITVQVQGDDIFLWAIVNDDAIKIRRWIEIFGTGFRMTENIQRKYIGTYQLMNGRLVFHVFELLQ